MGGLYYVYIWFRPWDGSPCYVGKGRGKRWQDFRRTHNCHLTNIVKKAAGELPAIIFRDGLSEKEAFDLEAILIAAIGKDRDGGPLANLTDGGGGVSGLEMPRASVERQRQKITALYAATDLAEKVSAGTKLAMSDPVIHKRVSDAQKKRFEDPEQRKLNGRTLGRKLTDEHRAKITAGLLRIGRKLTPEHKAKLIAANKARTRSPESLLKIGAESKRRAMQPGERERLSRIGTLGAQRRWHPDTSNQAR